MSVLLVVIGVMIGIGISILVMLYRLRVISKTFLHPHTRMTAKELRDMGVELPKCPDDADDERPVFISDVGLVIRWYGTMVGIVSYKIHGKNDYDPREMKYDGMRANKAMKMAIDYEYRINKDEVWVSVLEGDFKDLVRAAGDMS